MDYYDTNQLIKTLDHFIEDKEKELEALQLVITNDVMHNVKIQQLQSEINELKIQQIYHYNTMTDQLLNNCVSGNCTNGCCRYKYWNSG